MKLIHCLGTNVGRTKLAMDYYISLNNSYQIRLYGNMVQSGNYNLLPQYAKNFKNVQSKFVQPKFALYFQQELFKLTMLRNYGGWWCNITDIIDEPLDDLMKKYDLYNTFSYIQKGCGSKCVIFISKDWDGWNFCDNLLDHMCNQVNPPHPYLIRTLVYTLAPLYPKLFKVIQNNKLIRLDMPHSEDTMINKEKNSAKAIDIMKRFLAARDRWMVAGKPLRSEEEKKTIFEICTNCDHVQKDVFGFKCGVCKCRLHSTRDSVNKIAMATEKCPLDKPKWEAKI